jgi:hypothetical protein
MQDLILPVIASTRRVRGNRVKNEIASASPRDDI